MWIAAVYEKTEHLDKEEKIELAVRNQDKLDGIRGILFKRITKLEERYHHNIVFCIKIDLSVKRLRIT